MWRSLFCIMFFAGVVALPIQAEDAQVPLRVLLITGGPQPVRVAVNVTMNGRPWPEYFEAAQQRQMEAIFSQLDRDQDGKVSAEESRRFPQPRLQSSKPAGDVHVAFNYRVIDADDDGQVSLTEYEQYARSFGDLPVWTTAIRGSRPDADLFRALDANRDRVVTEAEWSAADKLFSSDRDGNRVLSVDELRPSMATAGPPEFVAGAAIRRKPLVIEWQEPGNEPVQATVSINFVEDAAVAPTVSVKLQPGAAERAVGIEQGLEREPVLVCDGCRIVLRLQLPVLRATVAQQQQLRQDYEAARERAGGAVGPKTEMSPRLKQAFLLADSNEDNDLEPAEFESYLDKVVPLEAATDAARLRFVSFQERPGLLPLVDLNLDGRLSLREIQTIPTKLKFVAGQMGKLVRDQVPSTLVIVLQRAPSGDATEQSILQNAGPPWFFRADRNQDGDLDRDEFLGNPEDFARLDVNKDGWIELDEAVRGDMPSPGGR